MITWVCTTVTSQVPYGARPCRQVPPLHVALAPTMQTHTHHHSHVTLSPNCPNYTLTNQYILS